MCPNGFTSPVGVNNMRYVREHGITPSSRPLVPLAATQELALRLGRRRDPEPLLVEVLAAKAQAEGELFYQAGPLCF